jgi:hypothetical protein
MSKLGILSVSALSLALAVATPAFAAGFRDVSDAGAMHVGNGGFSGTQATIGSAVSSADASYCRSLGAYYDSTSGEYMDDTGLWRPCP